MRRPFIALLLFTAASATAQMYETIEVRVANVDVVVTDRTGRPVHGLQKEDFQVLENGFSQPITNFHEIRGEITPYEPLAMPEIPPEQRRRVVIFIDQEGVHPRRREDAIAAVRRALDNILRPGDEAMVVGHYQDRRVVAPLTSDRDAVKRALDETSKHAHGGALRQAARDHVLAYVSDQIRFVAESEAARRQGGGLRRILLTPDDAYRNSRSYAKGYVDEQFESHVRLLSAMQRTLVWLAGLEGKKVLLFIGGDLQARPGIDLYESIDNLFNQMGINILNAGGTAENAARTLTAQLTDLASLANANGVTMYLVNASDRGTRRGAAGDELDGLDDAGGGVNIDTAASMTALASATGGRALVNSINFDLALENLGRDLSSYYSLGFKPASGGGERTIVVKTKKKGLTVRTRRSYTLKSNDEEAKERVVANAFHPRMTSDLQVSLEVGTAAPNGEHFTLPVTVKFPSDITTIPDHDGFSGEFAIYFVTASLAGNLSPVAKEVRPFRYHESEAELVRAKPITYTASLRVRKGEQLVSVAVVDRLAGRSGFARANFRTE